MAHISSCLFPHPTVSFWLAGTMNNKAEGIPFSNRHLFYLILLYCKRGSVEQSHRKCQLLDYTRLNTTQISVCKPTQSKTNYVRPWHKRNRENIGDRTVLPIGSINNSICMLAETFIMHGNPMHNNLFCYINREAIVGVYNVQLYYRHVDCGQVSAFSL